MLVHKPGKRELVSGDKDQEAGKNGNQNLHWSSSFVYKILKRGKDRVLKLNREEQNTASARIIKGLLHRL
jgi:hypothetical protein